MSTKGVHRGLRVCARNFCKRYGINATETRAFRKPAVTSEGILVLDLNEIFSVGGKQIVGLKAKD